MSENQSESQDDTMTPGWWKESEQAFAAWIGRRLREERQVHGWSLPQASRASQGRFSAPTLGSYERCERQPPIASLASLAALYGVPVVSLLPVEDPCTHDSRTSVDGPVDGLPGRIVVRWRCDGCGRIEVDGDALARLRLLASDGEVLRDLQRLTEAADEEADDV